MLGKINQIYKTKFYQFAEYPESDSCWSLSTGPDGRIYAAACVENTPGRSAKVTRYNEENDSVDYLFDVAEKGFWVILIRKVSFCGLKMNPGNYSNMKKYSIG